MVIISMLTFKESLLLIEIRKLFLKNNSLLHWWWRTYPHKLCAFLRNEDYYGQMYGKVMTVHFIHCERHFLTWWLLSEAAWRCKNNQVVNVPALLVLHDVNLLLLIPPEIVQIHLEYSVWGKMALPAQTFSMYSIRRTFEFVDDSAVW